MGTRLNFAIGQNSIWYHLVYKQETLLGYSFMTRHITLVTPKMSLPRSLQCIAS